MGASTAFERLSSVRQWFPELPYLAIGNEAGAQLILTAMRAGASDDDLKNLIARIWTRRTDRYSEERTELAANYITAGTTPPRPEQRQFSFGARKKRC
jgi:hypothetical protein